MGLTTNSWGKEGWHFIHCVSLAYPNDATKQIKTQYKAFFKSLGYVLPCPSCSKNFKLEYATNPPKFTDSKELFNWTVDLHNKVNKTNSKKEYSYEEAFNEVTKNIQKQREVYSNKPQTAQNGLDSTKAHYLPIIAGLSILGGLYLISRK
jgi:hypothetical protein